MVFVLIVYFYGVGLELEGCIGLILFKVILIY